MTSFTQVMPWAFKLCLAKVTAPSLLYMTVAYVYTVNRCCQGRLHGWVFWQLLTALSLTKNFSNGWGCSREGGQMQRRQIYTNCYCPSLCPPGFRNHGPDMCRGLGLYIIIGTYSQHNVTHVKPPTFSAAITLDPEVQCGGIPRYLRDIRSWQRIGAVPDDFI